MATYCEIGIAPNKDKQKYAEIFAKWVHNLFDNRIGTLIDYGCGYGDFSLGFKKIGYNVIAMDNDNSYGKRIINEGVTFIHSSHFKNYKGIDFIFCKSTIEHLDNPMEFLKDCYNVLKNGGKIFIFAPCFSKCYKEFYSDSTHKSPVTMDGITHALKLLGFKVLIKRYYKGIPYVWRWIESKAFDYKWFGGIDFIILGEKTK